MSSTSDPRFICLYGTEWSPQLKSYLWVWYAADIDNNHLLQLPLFHIPDTDVWDRGVVSLGSKIYCFMAGSCHVLCLDTTRPEIGWTTIYSPLLKRKVDSFPAVADGKIYLIDSFLDKPWAEVFDPCNQNWDNTLDPLPLDADTNVRVFSARKKIFTGALVLDDDGADVARKVIILASYISPHIYVYDVGVKSWVVPPPPKLRTSFFFDKFPEYVPSSNPVVVDKTVYWYTARSHFICAYNVETGDCSLGYFKGLNRIIQWFQSGPDSKHRPTTLLHLSGKRFCLNLPAALLFFHFSEEVFSELDTPYPVNIIVVEFGRPILYGESEFKPQGAIVVDGRLKASKLRPVVNFVHPVPDEIDAEVDYLDSDFVTKDRDQLQGFELKFVPSGRIKIKDHDHDQDQDHHPLLGF